MPGQLDPQRQKLLEEFVEEERRHRREGKTIEALHAKADRMMEAIERIANDRLQDRFDSQRYGRRLRAVERQMEALTERPEVPVNPWRPDPAEITGTHQFAVLQAQFMEEKEQRKEAERIKRDSGIWWKRQRWLWGMAALGALILALFTAGCSVASVYVVNKTLLAPTPSK